MKRYEFTGWNAAQGAYMQGALQAVVFGPEGRDTDARTMAGMIADGWSRKAAADEIQALTGADMKGFRVVRADKIK